MISVDKTNSCFWRQETRLTQEKKGFHFLYCLVSYFLIGIYVSDKARNCCDLDSFNLHIQTKFLPIRQQKLWEMYKWRSRLQNSRFSQNRGGLGSARTYLNMQNADSFAVYENVQCEKHRLML